MTPFVGGVSTSGTPVVTSVDPFTKHRSSLVDKHIIHVVSQDNIGVNITSHGSILTVRNHSSPVMEREEKLSMILES